MVMSHVPTQARRQEFDTTLRGSVSDAKLREWLSEAARVVAPLWPISTFAARSPWMGVENLSFVQVSRKLKKAKGIHMYPGSELVKAAIENGEIEVDRLEAALREWVIGVDVALPIEEAFAYCRGSIFPVTRHPVPKELGEQIKIAAEKLRASSKLESAKDDERPKGFVNKGIAEQVDYHTIKWCKFYLDESQGGWKLPKRERGLYAAWRQAIGMDPALTPKQRRFFKDWPVQPVSAIRQSMNLLRVSEASWKDHLEHHFLSLPGWAGVLRWRAERSQGESMLVEEYAAVRLSMECMLSASRPSSVPNSGERGESIRFWIEEWYRFGGIAPGAWEAMPEPERHARFSLSQACDSLLAGKLWLEAWENTYEAKLRKQISDRALSPKSRSAAQFAFCIDVRSEPFRRRLERAGDYETYGIAGFFGLPIEIAELERANPHPALPVILKPKHLVKETADLPEMNGYLERRNLLHSVRQAWKSMKHDLGSGMVLPEASGPWLTLHMLINSILPDRAGAWLDGMANRWLRKPQTALTLDSSAASSGSCSIGMSVDEQAIFAHQAMRAIGLTEFAPLVVFCGHGSRSKNNPYASKLDCGACGGISGRFNARVLAEICNREAVRSRIAELGLSIPRDTAFAAAEHVTTTDDLRWVYVPATLSPAAQEAMEQLQARLPKICSDARSARIAKLPRLEKNLADAEREASRSAADWSEVRPEWGLARNAAFVVGRRELTKETDLEGRAFLHSYDWTQDSDGSILAGIVSGPATVTQWINLQYYASTVVPDYYGSGSKTTQTVTSGLGVMQGNASDLMTGLPMQSVRRSHREAYHSPLRLLVVIQAPMFYIERLLREVPDFRRKVQGEWLRLASIDENGKWTSWTGCDDPHKNRLQSH